MSVSEPPRESMAADRRSQSSTVASTTPRRSRTFAPDRWRYRRQMIHKRKDTARERIE